MDLRCMVIPAEAKLTSWDCMSLNVLVCSPAESVKKTQGVETIARCWDNRHHNISIQKVVG